MVDDAMSGDTDRRYMSRKFALAAAAFVAGVVFFAVGKLSSAEWTAFSLSALALYMAGNVGDSWVDKVVTYFAGRKSE
jgi:hypothetical protein